MATFTELASLVTAITEDYNIDTNTILCKAENDFIEKTNCTEAFSNVNSNTLNLANELDPDSGVLSDLYDLPSAFVREYRVEWNGYQLIKVSKAFYDRIYNTENAIRTGTPTEYLIENEHIRLLPKPTSHSYLSFWYCIRNLAVASPIIHLIDQEKIIDYAIARVLEINGREDRALYYWQKYNANVIKTYNKYKAQRFHQDIIIDGTIEDHILTVQQRLPIITE